MNIAGGEILAGRRDERHMSDGLAGICSTEHVEHSSDMAFFITDGNVTVGPVGAELLVRGIQAGKVPLEACVWCAGWDQWQKIHEYAAEIGVMPTEEAVVARSKRARVSDLSPLQLPSTDVQRTTLSRAQDLNEAASLFFSFCASATSAECGWVHVYSKAAGGAMVTLEGIGPRATFGVGRTIDASDHALRVARDGRTVLSEPIPGVVGSATVARVLATGVPPTSVLMTPVLCAGQLLVMLELGVASRLSGFCARDAAVTEQIARDFSAIARKRAWHR